MTNPELVGIQFPQDEYEDSAPDLLDAENWNPVIGSNFLSVSGRLRTSLSKVSATPAETHANWEKEVLRVTRRCLPSTDSFAQRAQLVFGRVQAGKTSNFTGVISLLADNNYDIFIVLAGINLNLRTQTLNRLRKDLGAANAPGFEVLASNTLLSPQSEAARIMRLLTPPTRSDAFADQFRKKLVYVVLKEDDNLRWINSVLAEVAKDSEYSTLLKKTHVAVIDDEVDQASPDTHTNNAARVGAIHEEISNLRSNLGTHTYMGYTATPYANLLMEEGSRLRCEVVTVLDPGNDYVGPELLFGAQTSNFATVIDDWDWDRTSMPTSLRRAFARFMVQAAIINGPREVQEQFLVEPFLSRAAHLTPTSMLVQPHQQVEHASKIFGELENLHAEWVRAINSPRGPQGQLDLALVNLWALHLGPALLEFNIDPDTISDQFRGRIETIIEQVQIREINGPGKARGFEFPEDDEFDTKPAWVLIGGQLLDRGQTLPTLVNTYMPRPPGGTGATSVRGNFDTIQQRGRFYGQRGNYLGLLRGMFDSDTLDTYREIARIEPLNIQAIKRLDDAGLGIDKLPLVLELGAGNLQAASSNKIPRSTLRLKNSTWLFRQVHFKNEQQSQSNLDVLKNSTLHLAVEDMMLTPLKNSPDRGTVTIDFPITSGIDLLKKWGHSSNEAALFRTAVELLTSYSQQGHDSIDLQLMSRQFSNVHEFGSFGEFRTGSKVLFQAPDKTDASATRITGLTSSNDSKLLRNGRVTIQVHFFNIQTATAPSKPWTNQVGLGIAFPDEKRLAVYSGGLSA